MTIQFHFHFQFVSICLFKATLHMFLVCLFCLKWKKREKKMKKKGVELKLGGGFKHTNHMIGEIIIIVFERRTAKNPTPKFSV